MVSRIVRQTFTSNTSWTAPAGISHVRFIGAGGGGGGAAGQQGNNSNVHSNGGGGGAASNVITLYHSLVPGNVYAIEIGLGGPGGTTSGADGTQGGDTTVTGIFSDLGAAVLTFPGGNSGFGGSSPGGGLPTGLHFASRPFLIGSTYTQNLGIMYGAGGNGAIGDGSGNYSLVAADADGCVLSANGGSAAANGSNGANSRGGGAGGGAGGSAVAPNSGGGNGGNGGNASDAGSAQVGSNGSDGSGKGSGGGGGGAGGGTQIGVIGGPGHGGSGAPGLLIIEWVE